MADDEWEKRERDRWKKMRDSIRSPSGQTPSGTKNSDTPSRDDMGTQRLRQGLERAEPMIDQITSLYKQFLAGIERKPPIAQRKQLEELMAQLMTMPKATPALKFRYTSLLNKFTSYKDRWDKTMKDLELGKIERRGDTANKKTYR